MNTPLENFEEAFRQSNFGCRRLCECGREFYNPNGGWTWEDGELEKLDKDNNATAVEWAVGTLYFEGTEFCLDCNCWDERASKIIGWLDSHAEGVANYLTLEKKRKQAEADRSPVVV